MMVASDNDRPRPRLLRVAMVTISLGSLLFAAILAGVYLAGAQRTGRPPADKRTGGPAAAGEFDLSEAIIPRGEILAGGPPKDGIPALTDPRVIAAGRASYLQDDDRVIGVVVHGRSRAYPLKILDHHEVVNDRLGGQPIAVTYCPLCDSSLVFDRRGPDGVREFGVSGLLYNSNVLMYDRSDKESLWSQMMARSVAGPNARTRLKTIAMEIARWGDWRSRYPATEVLATETGYSRNYQRSPYVGYFADPRNLMFPVDRQDSRLPPKTPVLGVWTDNVAKAYPLEAFDQSRSVLNDELDGRRVTIEYDAQTRTLRVTEADDGVQWAYAFWFAWYAFHPDTGIFG